MVTPRGRSDAALLNRPRRRNRQPVEPGHSVPDRLVGHPRELRRRGQGAWDDHRTSAGQASPPSGRVPMVGPSHSFRHRGGKGSCRKLRCATLAVRAGPHFCAANAVLNRVTHRGYLPGRYHRNRVRTGRALGKAPHVGSSHREDGSRPLVTVCLRSPGRVSLRTTPRPPGNAPGRDEPTSADASV